jgi:hypothetical protein
MDRDLGGGTCMRVECMRVCIEEAVHWWYLPQTTVLYTTVSIVSVVYSEYVHWWYRWGSLARAPAGSARHHG